jgi:hypothetical protein
MIEAESHADKGGQTSYNLAPEILVKKAPLPWSSNRDGVRGENPKNNSNNHTASMQGWF